MKQMQHLLLYAVIGMLSLTCNKTCPGCQRCKDLIESPVSIVDGDVQWKAPCYNPANGDEFVYYKVGLGVHTLMKCNISTMEESVVLNNVRILSQPKWGRNGYIVFDDLDFLLHIIKPDGSNHQVITPKPYFLYPDWKNDSTIVSMFQHTNANPNYRAEINIRATHLDTLKNLSAYHTAGNSIGEIALKKNSESPFVTYVNLAGTEKDLGDAKPGDGTSILGIAWSSNNTDIFYTQYRKGIFRVNKETEQVKRLKNACDTRSYRHLSISPDGKKILIERVNGESYPVDKVKETSHIYIMDIDGGDEELVL